MESLLSFLVWIGLMVGMVYLGRNAQSLAQEHMRRMGAGTSNRNVGSNLRWVPPEKDADPVCAKMVATAKAKSSVHAGLVYYFCSRECREIFEAAPKLYVGQPQTNLTEHEHSHA